MCAGHYADDTFVLYYGKKLKTIETIVNTELKAACEWLKHNRLSLNEMKTELIFFHSARHKLCYDDISIKLSGIKLSPVEYIISTLVCILINILIGILI